MYHPGERLEGEVVIVSKGGPLQHGGMRLTVTGSVQMRLSEKAVGVFESLFINVKPITLLNESVEVSWDFASWPQLPKSTPPGNCRSCLIVWIQLLTSSHPLSAAGATRHMPSRNNKNPFRCAAARAVGEPWGELV